ncbi:MAG: hypothetical protein MHM6MM_004223 [Cercozoa sp. M6MM]
MALSDLSVAEKQELMTAYACLILQDDGIEITEEKVNELLAAADADVPVYWPKLFADLLAGKDIKELLLNAGAAAAPAGGAAAGGAGEAAAEEAAEEEEEEEEESEEEMGFGGLF